MEEALDLSFDRLLMMMMMMILNTYIYPNPSARTMALGSTQPLTNEYREYFLVGKSDRCVLLITLPPSCAECHEIWEPQAPGNLRASPGL